MKTPVKEYGKILGREFIFYPMCGYEFKGVLVKSNKSKLVIERNGVQETVERNTIRKWAKIKK